LGESHLNRHVKKGFLLIEMIIALSVVAIVLGALLQVFSHSLKNANAARRVQVASYLAEIKLWETLWEETLTEGWSDGTFEEEPELTWSQEVILLYRPEPPEEEANKPGTTTKSRNDREELPPTELYEIRVYVNWMEFGKKKNYELITYRLVPIPEDEARDEKS